MPPKSSSSASPNLSRPTWTSPPSDPKSDTAKTTKQENKIFGTSSFGIKIENTPGRGRGVFATKAFKRGDTLYANTTRPPAAVLSTDKLSTNCSACFLTPKDAATAKESWFEEKLKRCATCKIVHYCSAACAKDDWPMHKTECIAFQALRKRHLERNPGTPITSLEFLPYEGSRALGRLMWAKKKAKDAGLPCQAWQEYTLLQSQIDPESDSMSKLRDEAFRLAFYVGIVDRELLEAGNDTALGLLMKAYGIEGNPELELMKLLSRYQTNAFTLDSPDLTALGVIVAPGLAMANHSCAPNAVVVFPKGKGLGQMTAIKPIKSGEEILVCYIDVASPYSMRQSELSTRYNFTCACSLCLREADSTWVDPRWCLVHPGCKKKGTAHMLNHIQWEGVPVDMAESGSISPPTPSSVTPKCSACGVYFKVNEKTLYTVLSRAKSILQSDETGLMHHSGIPRDQSIRAVQTICSQLQAFCPSSSHPLIPLQRLLVRLLTMETPANLQELASPMHHLSLALEAAQQVYAPTHPTMAILLAQKARLLGITFPVPDEVMATGRSSAHVRVELKRLESALIVLREASLALAGCFGREGGVVGIGIKMEIKDMEMETQAYRMNFRMAGITI